MRTYPALLLVISALSLGQVGALSPADELPDVPCRARAWVRAPNLAPGKIVQGDVKVKLDGSCDEVLSYSLGLRFAERSWVKTRREGAVLPVRPADNDRLVGISELVRYGAADKLPHSLLHSFATSNSLSYYSSQTKLLAAPLVALISTRLAFHSEESWNDSIYDDVGGRLWSFGFGGNNSALDKYESDMKNPALWVVHGEERIAFETKYDLASERTTKTPREIVKTFALLVPSTNYPAAFGSRSREMLRSSFNVAGGEHIYQYFVDMTFVNGTHREIEAGYTSFDTVTITEPGHAPVSVNVTATRGGMSCKERKRRADDAIPRDEFTLEVTFPDGMDFEQGSINNITIVSHQLGPGTQRALSIESIFSQTLQKNHWAAKHAADTEAAEDLLLHSAIQYRGELLPTLHDEDIFHRRHEDIQVAKATFAQDLASQNHTTEPVTAQFVVPARTYPPFEMYYQTSEVELWIHLQVRNVSETGRGDTLTDDEYDSMPSEREGEVSWMNDEEYDWTPNDRKQEPIFRMKADTLRATIPISVHRKPEQHAAAVLNTVHYLSPEARAPLFVDPAVLPQLFQMTPEERNTLAPLCRPQIISKYNDEVVKDRYFMGRGRALQALYYVGDTWIKKVLARGDDKAAQQDGVLVVQA